MSGDTMIRVTVAPGSLVTVPHPSGMLPEPYTVRDGETVRVTADRADDLWRRGLILHPTTGALHPSRQRRDQFVGRVTLTVDGQTYDSASPQAMAALVAAEQRLLEANPPRAPEPIRAGPDWSPGRDFITSADGRPWSSS